VKEAGDLTHHRRQHAAVVARLGLFHFDDIGAEVGQHQRRVRPGQQARQIEDL
jgi:hypothetical protein